ncbi:phosphoserine transaminase [Iamia majanohamensis]|uniref:phosphoserine transaminase n=1 Tax=Iamia majanohamensis TaxID=467976 RepID=A0AAE9Y6A7_9ACTN|nr:phosphoserine transaminase [Iamia majanohamensis]WCO66361.1 phosphoserine transaminase [Iamia majanohamensis]
MSTTTPEIRIPADLLPADGRFCCGPSKVRPEAVAALAAEADEYLGTSHRKPTVQFMVSRLRNAVAEMFALPDGYEVLLGNGGTTAFWDALSFGAIDDRSHHLVFGEFSGKFAEVTRSAPHLGEPSTAKAEPGSAPALAAVAGADAYCLTHNETSTGVAVTPSRPEGADEGALVLVDATSAAGGLRFDAADTDVYYFAPQKCFASDGGLWLAACSPAAIERIERIAASDRWAPASLDLGIALENSRKDQTYNTPALATIFLAVQQAEWVNQNGGLGFAAGRCAESARTVYEWADAAEHATPFVTDPDLRSQVVATIDLVDDVDATLVAAVLRANGILDTESYRKLGRNQLRFALFPAIDAADVAALTQCVDHVVAELRSA